MHVRFINSLEPKVESRVWRTLDLLAQFGAHLGMPQSKSLGRSLFELRVKGTLEIRLLYGFHNDAASILDVLIKKSRTLPPRAISQARQRLRSLDNL